ncbi:MAG: response regulator [Candidatus Magasanikbacteria bacterium]|nr:response regulator [Candidatus Magasanikbacteria bacterium]
MEKIHVLLIEEDFFLAEIYKKKFEMEKFKVSIVRDGESGLQTIQKKKPDVVVLDILLPKMDGFAVLDAVKKDREIAHIPLIFLTSLGKKNDVERGFALGAFDYLIKTHNQLKEVVDAVKKALEYQ